MSPEQEKEQKHEQATAMPGLEDPSSAPDLQTESQLERVWNRVRNYGFSIGNWNFLLPQGLYSELMVQPEIAPLPNSPSHFLGLTNVRGNLVPVYRLELWMDDSVKTNTAPPRYALMIDEINSGIAIVVGDKPQSVNLRDCQAQAWAGEDIPPVLNAVIDAAYRSEGKTWYLVDHRRLFEELCRGSREVKIA